MERLTKKQRGFVNIHRKDWKKIELANKVKFEADKDVYFIQCIETKRIKIGISDSVSQRLSMLQHYSPTKLKLLTVVEYAGRPFELHLHNKYKEHRYHGEWFNINPELELLIQDIIVINERNANNKAEDSI